jgi:hypothetical protein
LLPGPERNDRLHIDFTYLKFAVIGLLSTKPDVNNHSNLWFHTVVQTGKLLATDRGTEIVDTGTYVRVCVCRKTDLLLWSLVVVTAWQF